MQIVTDDKIIDVHMIDNRGFIWNADDWYVLRTRHRLLGSLIGSLPTAPRQENHNGLPSLLLPEEVRLIVESGIGRTVEYPSFKSLPNECTEFLKNDQEQKCAQKIKEKYALQKAESISKLVVNAVLADGDKNCKEVKELNQEVFKIKPFNMSQYNIILLDELSSEVTEVSLPRLVSNLEQTRYKVFKDLWSKGFYLTCGMKFGGDFLVYEGDPLAYHAKYIVNCRNLEKKVMVSRSRVGSITKKKMVLASIDGNSLKYSIYHLNDQSEVHEKSINFTFNL